MDGHNSSTGRQVYDVHKSSLLPQESHEVKLTWDKRWHKGNQSKEAHTAVDYNKLSACALCNERVSQQHWITQCQKSTLLKTRSQYIAMVEGDIRREKGDTHEKTARWMEIILDIAAAHSQRAGEWIGMWPPSLRQTLKSRLENSSNYANVLTNLSEIEVSKTLAGPVSELWTERTEAVKQIEQIERGPSHLDQRQ